MQTAATLLHAAGLTACFLAYLSFSAEFTGMNRAIRTIATVQAGQSLVIADHTADAAEAALT